MATASNDMKNFYRQKKANKSGISKSSSKSKSKNISPKLAAAISSDLQEDNDKEEQVLMQFDMNMSYGPCVGMTRLARWERACRLGMNPPPPDGLLVLWDRFAVKHCFYANDRVPIQSDNCINSLHMLLEAGDFLFCSMNEIDLGSRSRK